MATRTDNGRRRFLATRGEAGNAGDFCGVHIKNPTDSGYIAILKRIIVANAGVTGSATAYIANFGRKDTDMAAGSYTAQTLSVRSSEDDGGDSVCTMTTNSPASASTDAPTVSFGKVAVALNDNAEVRFDIEGEPDSGIVLVSGTGFVVKAQGAALNDMDVTFDWVEYKDLSA